jgi:hypothetical protein
MKIRHIAVLLAVLSLTGCQSTPSQPSKTLQGQELLTVLAGLNACDTGSLNLRCIPVTLSQTGKIDDIDDLHFKVPQNHFIFFKIDTLGYSFAADGQGIVFPTSPPTGFDPPPPNEFSCRAVLARKWVVCINRRATTGKFKYQVNVVVDSTGALITKDPAMVND